MYINVPHGATHYRRTREGLYAFYKWVNGSPHTKAWEFACWCDCSTDGLKMRPVSLLDGISQNAEISDSHHTGNVSRETDDAIQSVKALLRKARKDAFIAGYLQGVEAQKSDLVDKRLFELYLDKYLKQFGD